MQYALNGRLLCVAAGIGALLSFAGPATAQFPDSHGGPPPAYGGGVPQGGMPPAAYPALPPGGEGPAVSGEPQGMVIDVRVAGNRTVKETVIRQHIKTRAHRPYDAQTAREDKRRLYATRHFHNIEIHTERRPEGVIVTFEVFERPTIDEVKFIGNRHISDRTLLRQSGLVKGDALNVYAVQEARRKVEEYYQSKGFPKTTVSILEGDRADERQVVLLVNEGKLERIWDVKFVGNNPEVVTSARLKTQIQSKPGFMKYLFRGYVDRAKIDEDMERLMAYYRNLGFFRARIGRWLDYDDSGQWLTLTFVIDEGPRYRIRDMSIVGNTKFDAGALMEQLELQRGDFFQMDKMKLDEGTLRDLYGSQGLVFADVNASLRYLPEPGWLDLVYQVKEGEVYRVGKINVFVTGEYPHTKNSVILNRLSLRPGDIIDVREVRASERRLKASQLFETNPTQGDPPKIVIVPPQLDEQSAASIAAGSPNYRGQSPDGSPRVMDLNIILPSPRARD